MNYDKFFDTDKYSSIDEAGTDVIEVELINIKGRTNFKFINPITNSAELIPLDFEPRCGVDAMDDQRLAERILDIFDQQGRKQ